MNHGKCIYACENRQIILTSRTEEAYHRKHAPCGSPWHVERHEICALVQLLTAFTAANCFDQSSQMMKITFIALKAWKNQWGIMGKYTNIARGAGKVLSGREVFEKWDRLIRGKVVPPPPFWQALQAVSNDIGSSWNRGRQHSARDHGDFLSCAGTSCSEAAARQ